MKTVLLFLFLLLIPLATAFDCSYFPDQASCEAANSVDEDLIANLIYTNYSHPDHAFITDHNTQISVNDSPNGYQKYDKGVIRDAWQALLTIQPSIIYEGTRYCPDEITTRAEYNYSIVLPPDYYNPTRQHGATCKILHSLAQDSASLTTLVNGRPLGTQKETHILNLKKEALIVTSLTIQAITRNDYYEWERYCCRTRNGRCVRYCWRCPYEYTTYTTDTLTITDQAQTVYYNHTPQANFTLAASYRDTTKAYLEKDQNTSIWLDLPSSNYTRQEYEYTANFTKKPFYLLELHAKKINKEAGSNLRWNDATFYMPNASSCQLTAEDFFQTQTVACAEAYNETPTAPFEPYESTGDWAFLLKLSVFVLILYLIYRALRKYGRRFTGLFVAAILALPMVRAEECGLTNLATCLPQSIYDFLLQILNAPLEPLLGMVKLFLETSPSVEIFHGVWAIIVYCLSLFYGLLFLYSGYQFLFSGHNVIKREMAKEWLKNTIIMIVLIQASFYLYGLVVDLGSTMSSAVLQLVDPEFFLITADNVVNIGLEFLLVGTYALVLFFTMLCLAMRYLIVAFGVLFAPIGIFCYFIPPLKSYGRLILNLLGMTIFVTFLDAIIILACSLLITIPLFASIKIIVMINCFLLVNSSYLFLAKHAISKSSLSDSGEHLAQAAKYIAMMV